MTRKARGSGERRVAGVARNLLRGFDASGEGYARAEAVRAWRAVAGEEVASHARGYTLRDGELVVYVDSGVWANELSALSETYRSAICERLGKEAVRSVRFTVSKWVAEERSWETADAEASGRAKPERVEPVPLSEADVAQLRMMAAAIHDEKVREAVIRAATRKFEWEKGIEARNASQKAVERARRPDSDAEH